MRDGRVAEVRVEVRRYSTGRRALTAAAIAGGFTVIGAATIVVPGVHFVAPWLLPILGIGIGIYLFRREMVIGTVEGDCPNCATPMTLTEGGAVGNDPLWLRCPSCTTPLEFVPGPP